MNSWTPRKQMSFHHRESTRAPNHLFSVCYFFPGTLPRWVTNFICTPLPPPPRSRISSSGERVLHGATVALFIRRFVASIYSNSSAAVLLSRSRNLTGAGAHVAPRPGSHGVCVRACVCGGWHAWGRGEHVKRFGPLGLCRPTSWESTSGFPGATWDRTSGPRRGRRLQTDAETPSASVCGASSSSQRRACHPQPVPVATAAPTCARSSVWAPNRADRGRLVSVGGACLSTPTQSRILPSCSSFLRGSTFPHAWSLRLSPDTRGGAFPPRLPR